MSFTTSQYFKGSIKLASATTNGEYSSDFDSAIVDIEKQILIDLLGYDLYSKFIAGLAEQNPLQKWLDLRDGKEYETQDADGRTVKVKWSGFQNAEYISCLAYFIYYEWQVNNYSQNSTTGENKATAQNSERASMSDYNRKLVYAYNKGVDLYGLDIESIGGINVILRSPRYQEELLNQNKISFDYYAEKLKPLNWVFS